MRAIVEALCRADVEQIVDRGGLLRRGEQRHIESARPVRAGVCRQSPGIAGAFDVVEQAPESLGKLAIHHHPVLAHPVELAQVLELYRAGDFAVAAGRAGPERVLLDHIADQRRQPVRGVSQQRVALVDQMVLDPVVDPLQCKRLAGQEGRAGGLAAPALGAGEGIEAILPREVGRAAHADPQIVAGIVGHDLLQIDRGHGVQRRRSREEQRWQSGDDVEVLASRQQHQKAQYGQHLQPVRRVHAGLQRGWVERGEHRGDSCADGCERSLMRDAGIRRRQQREAEAIEGKVGDHDDEDQRQHQQRLAIRFQAARLEHKAAPERVQDCKRDQQFDPVLDRGVDAAGESGKGEAGVVADDQQLQLANQQRQKAEKDRRVHQTGCRFQRNHLRLQQPESEHAQQPGTRLVGAGLGLKVREHGELAPAQITERRQRGSQQQRDRGRTHEYSRCKGAGRRAPVHLAEHRVGWRDASMPNRLAVDPGQTRWSLAALSADARPRRCSARRPSAAAVARRPASRSQVRSHPTAKSLSPAARAAASHAARTRAGRR